MSSWRQDLWKYDQDFRFYLVSTSFKLICRIQKIRLSHPNSRYIGTTNGNDQTTYITVARDVLKTQPWAYNTAECYGCQSCDSEPSNVVDFTQLEISYKGQPLKPTWVTHTTPTPICSEKAIVNADQTVTISFQQ